jgi:hypothetical protein
MNEEPNKYGTDSLFDHIKNLPSERAAKIKIFLITGFVCFISALVAFQLLKFNSSLGGVINAFFEGFDVFLESLLNSIQRFVVVVSLLIAGYIFLYKAVNLLTQDSKPENIRSNLKVGTVILLTFLTLYIPLICLLTLAYAQFYSNSSTFRRLAKIFVYINFFITLLLIYLVDSITSLNHLNL